VVEVGRPPPRDDDAAGPDGSALVIATLADHYNLITGQDEAPAPIAPEDEAVR
jgi:hypothetical protein